MLLSAQLLVDVSDVNHYRTVTQLEARAGSTIDVFMRLVDREADKTSNPPGRRFMPAPNSTLMVSLKSVYPRKQLAFPAKQPFPQDPSVWKFTIQPDDGKIAPAPGGGPLVDFSNIVPLGEPFDFNAAITDFGMVGTFGLILTLTESASYTAATTLSGVVAGDELDINGIAFTAVAAGATGTQFNVGGDDSTTASNLAGVINANPSAQVSAVASGATVIVTSLRAATTTWSSLSPHFTVGTPTISPSSRVTTGWVESGLSIAPSIPTV